MTPSKLQIYQTTPSNTHSTTEGRPQMPDDTSKIILKPEDLHSISTCEKAIYNLAENTNRDPLEIWQSTEAELSAQAAELKQSPGNSSLQVSITICAVMMIYTIYTREIKTAGLNQETMLGMISILPYILTTIAAFIITWIPRLLKFFSAALGFGFTLITTLLGTYSTTQNNPNPILYYLVGAYIYYVPPCALLCGLLWWIWTSSNNEQKSRKDQLAILRTTRPLLTKESRQNEDSASGTIRHFTAANTKSKVSISLALTAYTLITAGLLLRNRISNQ